MKKADEKINCLKFEYSYDEIMKILAPQGINVLAFCEDDAHELSDCDRNAQYFLMPENDMATNNIKHSMEYGEFYTVSKIDANDCIVLVKVDYVAAGVPYLVYNSNKAQVDIAGRQGVNKNLESDEEAQYVFTEGALTGYLKTTATNAGIYMLKTVDGVPGFYKTETSGFADASTCTLTYLGKSPVVYIVSSDGVNAVKLDADKAQHIYDVLGRQLSAPQKGVNIIDGKKVIK